MKPEIGKEYNLCGPQGKKVRYERFDDGSAAITGDEEWIFEKGAWEKGWSYLTDRNYTLETTTKSRVKGA